MSTARRPAAPPILVGTDFSKSALNAIERAIRIAKALRSPLHVVHASSRLPRTVLKSLHLRDDDRAVRQGIHEAVALARAANVTAHGHHVHGAPTSALRAKARELSAALIVVGARGRSLPDTFVGSTAERIAPLARIPVLLVRTPPQRPYRDVVVAVDTKTDLEHAVAAAALVAPVQEVSLVHAYEGPFEATLRVHGVDAEAIRAYRHDSRRQARAALLSRMREAGLDPGSLVLRHGDPRRVLVREERSGRDGLLVIQRGRSALGHLLLGSVTRSVVAHGRSDVLIT